MKIICVFIAIVCLTGCYYADNTPINQELYARVFNQCVHDSANGSAFMNDIINACAGAARHIAIVPQNTKTP